MIFSIKTLFYKIHAKYYVGELLCVLYDDSYTRVSYVLCVSMNLYKTRPDLIFVNGFE
jgi:hypothetical protein